MELTMILYSEVVDALLQMHLMQLLSLLVAVAQIANRLTAKQNYSNCLTCNTQQYNYIRFTCTITCV